MRMKELFTPVVSQKSDPGISGLAELQVGPVSSSFQYLYLSWEINNSETTCRTYSNKYKGVNQAIFQ